MNHIISFDEICDYVANFLSVERGSLLPSTTLNQLGVDGDDADEFMQAFAKHFSVDLNGFRFTDYFGHEANAWLLLAWLIRRIQQKRKMVLVPLRLSDLHRSAMSGKWESDGAR